MNDLPSISIVTPTLNQAAFIQTTVDSVFAQNYPKLNYLVYDAGSSDNTHGVLEAYGTSLNWLRETGIGQAKAINRGWHRMDGEILAWINSDDFYYPGALKRIGQYLQKHPDIDMVYGRGDFVDAAGRIIRPYPTKEFDYLSLLAETENYILQPAVFFRRRVLEFAGSLDETLDYGMDFEFWLRVGRLGKVAHIPDRLAALRIHSQAKSVSQLDRFGSELVRIYEGFFAANDLPPELRKLEKQAMANIYHRAAHCAFWGNNEAMARTYVRKSRQHRPWPPRSLWFWVALGRVGRNLIENLYRNPYFPGR